MHQSRAVFKLSDVFNHPLRNYRRFPGVYVIRNIMYDTRFGDSKNMLDIYLSPEKKKGKYPVIFNVHGGGFVGGGNMSNMMKPRTGADMFTRLTTIFAFIFFFTSLSLAVIAKNSAPETDILKLAEDAPISKEIKTEAKEIKKEEKPQAPISQ